MIEKTYTFGSAYPLPLLPDIVSVKDDGIRTNSDGFSYKVFDGPTPCSIDKYYNRLQRMIECQELIYFSVNK